MNAVIENEINEDIIEGVSVITIGEAKGHDQFVDEITLETALSVFPEKLKVKINHGDDVSSIIGYATNPRIEGDKLRADFHLFTSSDRYSWLKTIINTIPDQFGTSIHFDSSVEVKDGKQFVRVDKLKSVDIVDAPAANEGLFSEKAFSMPTNNNPKKEKQMQEDEIKELVGTAIAGAVSSMKEELMSEVKGLMEPKKEPEAEMQEGEKPEYATKEDVEKAMSAVADKAVQKAFSEIAKNGLGGQPVSAQAEPDKPKSKSFSEIVNENKQAGMSDAIALRTAIHAHQKLYSDWRNNGATL